MKKLTGLLVVLLLCALSVGVLAKVESDTPIQIRFHVTKVSSSDNSDEHSARTNYTVEGYDVSSETLFRGECTDVIHFDHEGKASMHIICVVPRAGSEYDVKLRPTSFSFPCDTPDGKCPGTDPNVDRYAYSAYTIRYQEERKKK